MLKRETALIGIVPLKTGLGLLGISRPTAYARHADGTGVPMYLIGNRQFMKLSEIEAYIDGLTSGFAAPKTKSPGRRMKSVEAPAVKTRKAA
jgi:hypothetical protein